MAKIIKKEEVLLRAKRDPRHAADICHLLIKEKVAKPYMRFGQLLGNALGVNDLYNIEDDDLLQLMEDTYERI